MNKIGEDLYQSILINPRDNDLRLVYADWLEEHGKLKVAEFIRAQIGLADKTHPTKEVAPGLWVVTDFTEKWKNIQYHYFSGTSLDEWVDWMDISGAMQTITSDGTVGLLYRAPDPAHTNSRESWNFKIKKGFIENVRCNIHQWYHCGPTIVKSQPVEFVDLYTVLPNEMRDKRGVSTVEPYSRGVVINSHIPKEWEIFLEGGEWWCPEGAHKKTNWYDWKDVKESCKGISHTALNWARHQSGLPLLEYLQN